mgnify:CR=1 FL=1
MGKSEEFARRPAVVLHVALHGALGRYQPLVQVEAQFRRVARSEVVGWCRWELKRTLGARVANQSSASCTNPIFGVFE